MAETWLPTAFGRSEYKEARKLGPVFDQHFILSAKALGDQDEFASGKFAGRYLYTGAKLPKAQAGKPGGVEVLFLGVGVDLDGEVIDDARLAEIVKKRRTGQAIANALSMCAGRYVFMVANSKETQVYLDPVGMLSAVYNWRNGNVASIPTLATMGPVQPCTDYPLWEVSAHPRGGRFAFGFTLDGRVRQLLPGTYVTLSDGAMHRHWPDETADFSCTSMADVEASVEAVHNRHVQVIGALAKARDVALPVTGGQDSRLLLAYARSHKDKIKCFYSHVTNHNTRRDSAIGKELCDLIGAEHTSYHIVNNFKEYRPTRDLPDIRRRFLMRQGYLLGQGDLQLNPLQKRELAAYEAVPDGHLVLRGHVTDICKAVLWRRIGLSQFAKNRNAPISTDRGIALMQLRPDDQTELDMGFFGDEYEAWQDTTYPNMHRRSIDFMGIEQYRPYSLGPSFYGYERNFYMSPGNDRTIIAALAKLPPDMRALLHVQDLLLAKAAPEFLDVEYVRASDNEMRAQRKPIETFLDPKEE